MNRNAEALLSNTVDILVNCRPRHTPSRQRLEQTKIVSHRGQHDNVTVRENTIPAFDAAVNAGVWGLELDIQYTADGEPVISHDINLKRVFDNPTVIADTAWANLHNRVSEVLHLEDFLERYAGRAHFMLELKARSPGIGEARMLRLLSNLEPATDFHILALETRLFTAVRDLPSRSHLPVSQFNSRHMLDYALIHGCAGLAGHYILLGVEYLSELQAAGQHIGTGFISSRGALWREINRGVDWIFSNHATDLQRFVDSASDAID